MERGVWSMRTQLLQQAPRKCPSFKAARSSFTGGAVVHRGIAQSRICPRWKTRSGSTLQIVSVLDVTEASFENEVLKSDVPVLVDFWADWCGPCKLISPIMDWAEKEFEDLKVVKIETDGNPSLVEKYNVYGLPTIILFQNGEEVEGGRHEGAISKAVLGDFLKKYNVVAVKH